MHQYYIIQRVEVSESTISAIQYMEQCGDVCELVVVVAFRIQVQSACLMTNITLIS